MTRHDPVSPPAHSTNRTRMSAELMPVEEALAQVEKRLDRVAGRAATQTAPATGPVRGGLVWALSWVLPVNAIATEEAAPIGAALYEEGPVPLSIPLDGASRPPAGPT